MYSLLVPVFNEEKAIESTIRTSHEILSQTGEEFEIFVIDDGSDDRTPDILKSLSLQNITIFTHPENRGYGSSMKTGIRHSKGDIIATVDADGTYPIKMLPTLLNLLREKQADMVVGARIKKGGEIPLIRRPAKKFITLLAILLTGSHIPDLNSGMRVFRRDLAERFMHLYPQRFSFTITITLSALTEDSLVIFEPIDYFKRVGKSTLSSGMNGIRNFLNFIGLIIRIITLFRPLKFFAWPAVILLCIGIVTILYTLSITANISDAGLLLLLSGVQLAFFGMLAEVVVRHRSPYPQEKDPASLRRSQEGILRESQVNPIKEPQEKILSGIQH